jgi:hypothetical protein
MLVTSWASEACCKLNLLNRCAQDENPRVYLFAFVMAFFNLRSTG